MESNKGNGRLAGKVAIVTGGGAREGTELGTGRATSVALAREGARVLVADLHADNAERTVAEIRAAGGEASAFAADVSKSEQCAAMVAAAVERYGALHVLVNNCGTGASGTVSGLDEATLERSLDVNLKSAIYSSKHAIPAHGRRPAADRSSTCRRSTALPPAWRSTCRTGSPRARCTC